MLTALLLSPALLADTGTCGTVDALAALQGRAAPQHPGMLTRPGRIGAPHTPAPPGGKTVYGGNYEFHLESANFTLNWTDSRIDQDAAVVAAEALETAWTSLLDEQGWTPPTSSDRYYLWVLLDPTLGGTTGYTTEYFSDDYPDGYPIIYLNPDYAGNTAFWQSLAAHEFMHAVQFAMREWSNDGGVQSWYWEASATHASELAGPSWDGHQYISAWYADQPDEPYDSYQGSHQYGMFVLNAWMDETAFGEGTMLAVWSESTDRPGDTWDTLIADVTGQTAAEVWAGFSGQYGNNELRESHLYTDVATRGTLSDGASGGPGYLGSDYWRVEEDTTVTVTGDAILGGAGAVTGTRITVDAGTLISVTSTAPGASYTLSLSEPEEPEDTGSPDDTGRDDGSDPGDDDNNPGDGAQDSKADAGGGCATAAAPLSAALVWSAGLLAVWRRRR